MAGKFIEKSGLVGVQAVAESLIQDFLADDMFEQIYPSAPFDPLTHKNVIIKSKLDPLKLTQPWAIKFQWDDPAETDGMMDVYVATPAQFNTTTGAHTTFKVNPTDETTAEALGILGTMNKDYLGTDGDNPAIIDDFPNMAFNRDPASKTFLYRKFIDKDFIAADPMAYMISMTERGLAVCVWDERSDEGGNRNSWFVVQRPVHSSDVKNSSGVVTIPAGTTVTTGKAPVHCIYGLSGINTFKPWLSEEYTRTFIGFPWQIVSEALDVDGTDAEARAQFWLKVRDGGTFTTGVDTPNGPHANLEWASLSQSYRTVPKATPYCLRRFVVREKDITAPYPTPVFVKDGVTIDSEGVEGYDYSEFGAQFGVPADKHTADYSAIMNAKQQVSVGEGNKYIVTFPNGLNTSRFAYTHEMDMVAYTSADVVSAGSEIPVPVYGEDRVYIGVNANGPNNTGMRVLFLRSGGGIEE